MINQELSATSTLFNETEITSTWNLLVLKGHVAEIRILEAVQSSYSYHEYTMYGYFTSAEAAIRALKTAGLQQFLGVYLTLQQCHPDLIFRVDNKLVRADKGKGTTDQDVVGYRYLYIDCDPLRLSGISSSDAEHDAALALCRDIIAYLTPYGFSEPIQCDSGNGAALLYPIDLPNTDENVTLIQSVLATLAARFDTAVVKIDTSVFNPSRICRLFGTLNGKGDHTPTRPYRLSRILSTPLDASARTSRDALLKVGGKQEQNRAKTTSFKERDRMQKWLEKWLKKHEDVPIVLSPTIKPDGAIEYDLVECFSCGHIDDQKTGIVVLPNGALGFHCFHGRCGGDMHWKDFRAYYEQRDASELSDVEAILADLDTDFIRECFWENEFGDAKLFATLYEGRVVFDIDELQWYVFGTHLWEADHGKMLRLVSEGVCAAYKRWMNELRDEGKEATDERKDEIKMLLKAITQRNMALCSARRGKSVVTYAAGNGKFKNQEIASLQVNALWWEQCDPYLLGCSDGVLDHKLERWTGELLQGVPEDRLRSCVPAPWEGMDAPRPALTQLVMGMFADRTPAQQKEMADFLQLMFGGLGLPSKVVIAALLAMIGRDGRNGKDTLLKHLTGTLGHKLAAPIEQAVILKRPQASAGAASPHIAQLEGMLMAWVSEPSKGERMDDGALKMLIGGGRIPGRKNYGNSETFPPTHLLILSFNEKPHINANDKSIWPKIFPVTLRVRYLVEAGEIEDEAFDFIADTTLPDRLEQELAGGLAWLVAGSLEFQRQRQRGEFIVPVEVVEARKAYRGEEDTFQIYIDEQCVTGEKLHVPIKDMYARYVMWCKDGSRKPMSDLQFDELMQRKKFEKHRYADAMHYQGVQPQGYVLIGRTKREKM